MRLLLRRAVAHGGKRDFSFVDGKGWREGAAFLRAGGGCVLTPTPLELGQEVIVRRPWPLILLLFRRRFVGRRIFRS